jgi:hypothetical protein
MVPYDGRAMAMKQLVKEMTNAPLRSILENLRPNHVHYTIPAFAAKGTVVLTSALQQVRTNILLFYFYGILKLFPTKIT